MGRLLDGRTERHPRMAGLWARAARLLRWYPSPAGFLGAAAGLSASLTPSLLPRGWVLQGILSGVGLAVGFGIGEGVTALARAVVGGRASMPRWMRTGIWILGAALALSFLVLHYLWQVDVRRLMGMETGVALQLPAVIGVTLVTGYLLVLVGRLVRGAWRRYLGFLSRLMPARWATAVGVLVAVVLIITVIDVVVAGRIFPAVNRAALAANARFEVGIDSPDSRFRSGGPNSLVPWETLGRQGRAFVAEGPGVEELTEFHSVPPLEPIRVYVGLSSADSLAERARLAVAELERTGGFDRQVLVVVNPTGTGWVDPLAVDPLEYMYNGDTAAVAVQYSYLPSWIVMVGNQDRSEDAAAALLRAVTERLERQPPSSRPLLLLYGESLGAYGSESVFTGLDDLRRRTDGVLWVGPPRASPLWRRFTFGRDPGSPIWRPVYQGGETVRFGSDQPSLLEPEAQWDPPRVVYLQHASDPITWLTSDLLFNRPEWMDEPRSPDISTRMPYIPIVTFWQVAVDLAVSTDVPLGHGHKFGTSQAEAWSVIAPPEGWSPEDTRRLVESLAE